MNVREYTEECEECSYRKMLINMDTLELWAVDHYALLERGYPEGSWKLLEDVSKVDLLEVVYRLLNKEI